MLGSNPFLSAQLVAERQARFATETAGRRWRRTLRQPHPAPPCAALAAQLPADVLDLRPALAAQTEAPATR